MIIAKIGDTILKLDSLKDAETLLAIAAKADRLDTSYDEHYKDYYHPANGQARITIEITDAELATPEQHRAHQAAREAAYEEKQRKALEAAAAEKTAPVNTN